MKGAQPIEGFVRLVCFKLKGQVCSCHELEGIEVHVEGE
jgi:hypothetical protein